ncbi:hypothetical protein XHV734_3632 [Xanthomonas hortorum pv. vitians]|nr:hypothetical protein XHV734_3632 [Xanthomonas hortorum pv. vitians]
MRRADRTAGLVVDQLHAQCGLQPRALPARHALGHRAIRLAAGRHHFRSQRTGAPGRAGASARHHAHLSSARPEDRHRRLRRRLFRARPARRLPARPAQAGHRAGARHRRRPQPPVNRAPHHPHVRRTRHRRDCRRHRTPRRIPRPARYGHPPATRLSVRPPADRCVAAGALAGVIRMCASEASEPAHTSSAGATSNHQRTTSQQERN